MIAQPKVMILKHQSQQKLNQQAKIVKRREEV